MSKKLNNNKNKPKIYELLFIVIGIIILVVLLFTSDDQNLKAHCKKAVCNEDNTICYNYTVDKTGKTIKTWEGSCAG